jgi:hypothetical protein
VTENIRKLLGRKEVAAKGGRQMFINVRRETEKVEAREGSWVEKEIQAQIKKRVAADEELKDLKAKLEAASPKNQKRLEKELAQRLATIEGPIREETKDSFATEDQIQGAIEVQVRKDSRVKEIKAALAKDFGPARIQYLNDRIEEVKQEIEADVRLEFTPEGKFIKESERAEAEADAAASLRNDRIQDAVIAMEYAATTGNKKMFEGMAENFASLTKTPEGKPVKRLSNADKAIINAFGRMMDEVKALNVFGTATRVPGIVRQGFVAANEYAAAVQNQEFTDPQTGQSLDIGSDLGQQIIKGKVDPTEYRRYRDPKNSREDNLEEFALLRLKQLARERVGKDGGAYRKVDPNLAELALTKLFGGNFEGEVEGVQINKTFPPLPERFTAPLIQYMESTVLGGNASENQKIVREAYGKYANEILDTYLFDPENDQVSDNVNRLLVGVKTPRGFEITDRAMPRAPVSEELAGALGPSALASAPGANGTDVAQSNKNATAQPNRSPVRESSRAATQSFVQSYANLTDSDMVGLDDQEVNAIYQAATAKAEADMAAGAVDSVVAASPGMDALAEMSGAELMRGLIDSIKESQARGDAETILRENLRRAATTKMFKSNSDFLEYVSKMPQGIKRATALRAREFLKLNGQGGFNWNKIATQIAAFGKDGKQATWAGLLGTDMETGGHAIYLNLDQIHEGDIVETMLEEMDHALTYRINNAEAFGMKLNSVQQSARDRLRTDFKRAVLKAGEGMTELAEGARGLTPEQKVAFYSNAFKDMVAESPDQFRAYYNLTNFDEFVVGIKKDGSFIDLLKELGFSEKAEGGFSISKFLKDIFTSLAELVTGRRLDANSELARAFSDAWTLSTGRDKTQWTVPPTQLSMALGVEATGGKATGGNETVRMRKEGGNAVYNAYLQQNEDG